MSKVVRVSHPTGLEVPLIAQKRGYKGTTAAATLTLQHFRAVLCNKTVNSQYVSSVHKHIKQCLLLRLYKSPVRSTTNPYIRDTVDVERSISRLCDM